MSILAMNKDGYVKEQASRESWKNRLQRVGEFLLIAAVCIVVNHIYALFSHGVRSTAMTYMFLFPLGTAVLYLMLGIARPKATTGWWGRLGVNLVGSGIATLTVGAFLVGILEIAGSTSAYIPVFTAIGWSFVAVGFISLLIAAVRKDP